MPRKKRNRFIGFDSLPNAFDRDRVGPGGAWLDRFMGGSTGLILELGCGKGEYSLVLGQLRPEYLVLGVDRRADRLFCGAREALQRGLGNVAFLRAGIQDLGLLLHPHSVSQIWIPFPDPLPRRRQAKHRVLGGQFLQMYRKLLRAGGQVRVKTDDDRMFSELLEDLGACGARIRTLCTDLFATLGTEELPSLETTFQRRQLDRSRAIKYVVFEFPDDVTASGPELCDSPSGLCTSEGSQR